MSKKTWDRSQNESRDALRGISNCSEVEVNGARW